MRINPASRNVLVALCIVISAAVAGCAAHFAADYDEIFDKAVTDTQKKTYSLLQKLADPKSDARKYSVAKPLYIDILSDIHSLQMRAEVDNVGGLNDITIKQLGLIDDSIKKLQALHELKPLGMNIAFVGPAQVFIDQQFLAILTWENAKKRGVAKK
jgi:hypothetical protein